MAALHSLRRIFVHYLEAGTLAKGISSDDGADKLKDWLSHQLISFQQLICSLIVSGEPEMQAASIRTMVEVTNSMARIFYCILMILFAVRSERALDESKCSALLWS